MTSVPNLRSNEDPIVQELEDGVDEMFLDDDQEGSSKNHLSMFSLPRVVKPKALTSQERYDVFSKQFKIADCRPSQVLNRVHTYIEEKLMNKKWLALWRGSYDTNFRRGVDILVEVDDVCGDQAHVALFEPLVCSRPGMPQQVIEAQLSELDHTLDIVELYPVLMKAEDEMTEAEPEELERIVEEKEMREIANIVDNVRFFFEHLRRDWDDEDEGDQAFNAYLLARLQLYHDVVSGCIPAPLVARYNRTLAKYIVRRKELLDYQARIQSEGEPTNSEAVECWRKYYEVLMLSGLLQIWETLQLRAEGPCFPRVLRMTKGQRRNNTVVTHIVTSMITPSMLKDFDDGASILQHQAPISALQECHEGDTILIYPGTYSGEGFHELTESVTIRGVGKREEVIIEAAAYDDLFVNISAGVTVTLENLTFVQIENTEGVLRVENGHAIINNCAFKCDGTGITVREGANMTMKGCSVSGAKDAAVELMPGCTAILEDNEIVHVVNYDCEEEEKPITATKGAVHLHIIEPPKVTMQDNKIRCEGGFGVTVGRRQYTSKDIRTVAGEMHAGDIDSGDAPLGIIKTKGAEALREFGIELGSNQIEEIPCKEAA